MEALYETIIAKAKASAKASANETFNFGSCLICGAPYTSSTGPCSNGHALQEELAYAESKGL